MVIGLGLIISGSTFAKEKVYFCAKGGSSGDGVAYISAIPCSKIKVGQAYKKWKKISAKKYITEIIDAYGPADSVIQSLYDDFEKHNLDTDIITKIVEKEKKKSKSQIAKDKKKREQAAKEGKWGIFIGESTAGVIAMCLDKNNLDKVRLSYFDDFESYKKFGSFKKGKCNYAITQQLNPLLFEKLWKNVLSKEKYEIEKKDIEKYIGWTQEIFYVSPKGEMIEVVALVFFEPNQTNEDGTPKVYTKNFYEEVDLKDNEDSFTVTVRSKIDKNIFIKRTKLTKKEATQAALKGCHTLYELRQDLLTNKKKQKKLMDACYVSSEEINKQEKEKELTGKPLSTKKLASLLLENVITINYDGKEESYIFYKKEKVGTCNGARCWEHIYEIREGPKMVGKGTWVYSKMSQFSPGIDSNNQNESDLSKFANLNKKLSKNSIKMSGSRNMYLQVYKKLDGVSTYAWLPGEFEDPKKNKKDDKINRAIVDITPTKDFDKRIETIRLVKLASSEGTQIAKKIEEEKKKDEEGKKKELLLAQKQAEEAKKKELLLAQKQAEEERKKQEAILAAKKKEEEKRKKELLLAQQEAENEKKKQELLLAQKKAEEERKKQELLLAQKKAEEEKKKQELLLAQKKAEEKKKVAEKPKEEFKPEEKEIDNDPPVILIAKTITVSDTSYEIEGKITDQSEKVFIEVDGRPVRVKGGKFKVQRFSPVDEQIAIVAIDQWGNRSEPKLVNIKIDIKDTVVAEKLEPLDPSNMRSKSNKNRVALIIGIEKYEQAPPASFANLDATYFYEYARKGFGVSKSNMMLLVDEDANLIKSLGIISKWLPGKVVKNQTELIIFFAGHGLASNDGKELYFLTQDSDPDLLSRTALSRTELFKEILSLEPKSVTMFMDTCYSGISRDEEVLLASARPIRIAADDQDGVPDNFTIFTASQLDQISSGLKEASHGIFSYYLMKGLEGKADANKDKQITNGELLAYMDQNVSQKASELGRQQNPSLAGDRDQVLLRY